MSRNKEFEQVDQALELFSKIVSENDDFDTQMNEIYKLTESLASNAPKISPEVLKEYLGYINVLLSVRDRYKDRYEELDQLTLKNTVRNEFASGGESIHRGYHCPSPVLDKLVGGCKRGKMIHKPRNNTRYYYKYYYDNNHIIRCDMYVQGICQETEFVITEDNRIYGISFHIHDKSTSLLSMEQYLENGSLDKYITVLPDLFTGRENHEIFTSEKYIYDEMFDLRKVIFSGSGIPKLNLISIEEYDVVYDIDNIIVGFNRK